MYLATDLLIAIERRHGPMHAILINWADQWRWKRQLAAIAKAPRLSKLGTLQMLHSRIESTTLEYTSPEALAELKRIWQSASNTMLSIADGNDAAWLKAHRFAQ